MRMSTVLISLTCFDLILAQADLKHAEPRAYNKLPEEQDRWLFGWGSDSDTIQEPEPCYSM